MTKTSVAVISELMIITILVLAFGLILPTINPKDYKVHNFNTVTRRVHEHKD